MMESDKNCAICGTETHSSNSRKLGFKERTICKGCATIIIIDIESYTDRLIDDIIKESKVKNET